MADLPPPPPVHRQPIVPLSSDRTQTTANLYENTDIITSLSAHRYAHTPLYVNTTPYTSPPLSQAITLGQSNVTQPSAVYAASYADNSQRLPIAVGQPGLSAFSRVDAPQNRPIAVDPTVQYVICTSASADNVWPTVTAHTAPLQSPSVHWRKRFAYDYIQPETGLGAPTHAAPAVRSGYIRPQTSDTHTHTSYQCALAKHVIW